MGGEDRDFCYGECAKKVTGRSRDFQVVLKAQVILKTITCNDGSRVLSHVVATNRIQGLRAASGQVRRTR